MHGRNYAALSHLRGARLEFSSFTPEILDLCEKRGVARATLGDDAALEFARVLSDIEAFDNFADFAATFGDQIEDRGPYEKCFKLKAGYVLVFQSGHPVNLGAKAVPPHWETTTRLMITAIEIAND